MVLVVQGDTREKGTMARELVARGEIVHLQRASDCDVEVEGVLNREGAIRSLGYIGTYYCPYALAVQTIGLIDAA
jgi:hypothetical protein